MRVTRLGLRRIATALAATGAALLMLAPLLPLAKGVPVEGLANSPLWRPPPWDWLIFLAGAAIVPIALALWDSARPARLVGPVLLVVAGTTTALTALHVRSSEAVFDQCAWSGLESRCGYGLAYLRPYEPAEALGVALLGGTMLLLAGLVLPLTTTFAPAESERRRRRLRSFSYM